MVVDECSQRHYYAGVGGEVAREIMDHAKRGSRSALPLHSCRDGVCVGVVVALPSLSPDEGVVASRPGLVSLSNGCSLTIELIVIAIRNDVERGISSYLL